MKCPISSAERRLEDAACFWQSAHEAYFHPDGFRRNVQSSIQAFRSVTWLLQKEKESIPSFADWYAKKQDDMRADERLRWLVEARNKIEKQGDLETHSTFTVEHTDSWLPPEKRVLKLPPTTRPEDIAKVIAATYPESRCSEGAILKLSREWVDSEMPTKELLSLLVHVYAVLQEVVLGAHHLMGHGLRESCPFYAGLGRTTSRLPENMTSFQFPAVSWFSLEHGVLKEYDHKRKTLTREEIEKIAEERYDNFGGMDIAPNSCSSFANICDNFFELGKRMLMKDGYHSMIAMIFTETGLHPLEFRPGDRADKHVMVRELASQCARLRAVSCILISEAWFAPISSSHGPYAVDHPNRQEGLSLVGFHKDEGFSTRESLFLREGGKVIFPEGQDIKGMRPEILNPVADAIRNAWD